MRVEVRLAGSRLARETDAERQLGAVEVAVSVENRRCRRPVLESKKRRVGTVDWDVVGRRRPSSPRTLRTKPPPNMRMISSCIQPWRKVRPPSPELGIELLAAARAIHPLAVDTCEVSRVGCPSRPSGRSRPSSGCRESRLCEWPTKSRTPLRCAASIIASQSAIESAIGLSAMTCLLVLGGDYRVLGVQAVRGENVDAVDPPLAHISSTLAYAGAEARRKRVARLGPRIGSRRPAGRVDDCSIPDSAASALTAPAPKPATPTRMRSRHAGTF